MQIMAKNIQACFVHVIFLQGSGISWTDKLLSFVLISFTIAFDFYVEAICTAKLDAHKTSKWGSIVTFISAFTLGILWNDHHIRIFMFPFGEDAFDEHGISGSVVLAVVFFSLGRFL